MWGRKKETVEFHVRIPNEGWRELTALLAAALGGRDGAGQGTFFVERGTNTAGGFAERVFRERAEEQEERSAAGEQNETEGAEERWVYRGEGSVEEPLSAPAPAGYTELSTAAVDIAQAAERENWEKRWERDCRRYDGGFAAQ